MTVWCIVFGNIFCVHFSVTVSSRIASTARHSLSAMSAGRIVLRHRRHVEHVKAADTVPTGMTAPLLVVSRRPCASAAQLALSRAEGRHSQRTSLAMVPLIAVGSCRTDRTASCQQHVCEHISPMSQAGH